MSIFEDMRLIKSLLRVFIFGFTLVISKVQAQDPDLIQFSGVVVESDSLRPVPYTKVIIKSSYRGTISDYYGYFSFVAQKSDTIVFSAIGYRKSEYVIPDTLSGNKYSLIQVMHYDTITLKETIIFPWPTRDQFKEVFLNMNIPDDDLSRASKNLDRQELMSKYESVPMEGSLAYKQHMQQYQTRLYWAGQYPPNNLLNPFAWAQFIDMWRKGKLKIQRESNTKQE